MPVQVRMAIRQPAAERRIHGQENPAPAERNELIYFGIKVAACGGTCLSPPLRVEHYAHAGE